MKSIATWATGSLAQTISTSRKRYVEIETRRAQQGVPLSQVIWTIIQTKENLWDFLKREASLDRPAEIFGELEFLQLLEQFFERAIDYAAIGYERETSRNTNQENARMSWEIEYKKKLRTPQEALRCVQSECASIFNRDALNRKRWSKR